MKRWISSTKRSVWRPWARRRRAASNTFFRSATPEKMAEICSKAIEVSPASRRATVVLPVPGGPRKMSDPREPERIMRVSAPSGPVRCSWPAASSSCLGRNRSASGLPISGAAGGVLWSNRSLIASEPQCLADDAPSALNGEAPPAPAGFGQFLHLIDIRDLLPVELAHDVTGPQADAGRGRIALKRHDDHAGPAEIEPQTLGQCRRELRNPRPGERAAAADLDFATIPFRRMLNGHGQRQTFALAQHVKFSRLADGKGRQPVVERFGRFHGLAVDRHDHI